MHQPILQGPSANAQITLGFAPVLSVGCWASLSNLASGSVSASVRLEPYITQGLSVHTPGPFQTAPPLDLKAVPFTNGLCNQGHDTRLNLQTGVLPLRLTAQYHLASDITATFISDEQPWHSDATWGPWLMKWAEKPPVTLMYNCYCLSCPVPTPVSSASPATSTQSVQTSLSVTGESSSTFTAQKQSIFRIGTARALGVPVLSVALLSLDGVPLQASFRRRLLDAASSPQVTVGIEVGVPADVSVTAAAFAQSVRSAVASGAVDAQLRAGGLAVQATLSGDVAVVTLAPDDVIHDRQSAVPPAIGPLADVTVDQGQPMPKQSFTVTTSGSLGVSVSASASNSTLVPSSNVVVTFDGTAYGVQANPAPGQSGTTYVLVTATDTAGSSNSEAFMLTVRPAQAGSASGAGIVIYAAAAGGGGLLLIAAIAAGFFVHHRRKRNKLSQVVSVAPMPAEAVERDSVQPFDAPAPVDEKKAPVPAPDAAAPSAPPTCTADSDPVASPRGQADLGLPARSD